MLGMISVLFRVPAVLKVGIARPPVQFVKKRIHGGADRAGGHAA